MSGKEYTVFTTEGVATVVTNATTTLSGSTQLNPWTVAQALPVTAYFTKGETVIYTSRDASCYHSNLYTCLEKGDLVFLFDANWPTVVNFDNDFGKSTSGKTAAENSGNLYKVVKISVEDPTSTTFFTEDRYRIVVDKVINWDGSKLVRKGDLGLTPEDQMIGHQWIIKFVPDETTGIYEYVQQCSGRGLCDTETGLCECFSGYTNDNCDLQSSLAV